MAALTRSLAGIALTAGAVYFFDPTSGRRRRLLLRDEFARAAKRFDLGARKNDDQTSELTHSLASRAKQTFTPNPTSDRAVFRNVRKTLREHASHPESISLAVDHGHVILRGEVSPYEHQQLLDEVRDLPGVRIVTDHLEEFHIGNGEDSLDASYEFKSVGGPSGWAIAGRVAAGCAATALIAWGVYERETLRDLGTSLGDRMRRSGDRFDRGRSAVRDAAGTASEAWRETRDEAASSARQARDFAEGARDAASDEYSQARWRQRDGGSGIPVGE